MKEENNETTNTGQPTEKEMNDMHKNAWLDFHADAQADKQEINRAYAITVNKYGSYKKIPYGVKELLKKTYNAHEVKWGENGTEIQKRFGKQETEPAINDKKHSELSAEQIQVRQKFLQNVKEHRNKQQSTKMEYEVS